MILNPNQESQLNRIQEKLKTRDIRLTQIRLEILKIIITEDHPTIADIIEALEKEVGKINVMSVYNTLNMLLENHVLFANTFNGKQICYEIQEQASCHLKCDQCLKVEHVDTNEVIKFLPEFTKIAQRHEYSLEHFKIEIHGLCENCQKKVKF